MPKYKISATVTQDLEVIIEADSLDEANKIAENNELLTDDFECINQEFKIQLVSALSDEYKDPALNCECGYQH